MHLLVKASTCSLRTPTTRRADFGMSWPGWWQAFDGANDLSGAAFTDFTETVS